MWVVIGAIGRITVQIHSQQTHIFLHKLTKRGLIKGKTLNLKGDPATHFLCKKRK